MLIEQIDKDKNLMSGHTENFLEAEIKNIINEDMRNKIIKAKIVAVRNGRLEGVYDGN